MKKMLSSLVLSMSSLLLASTAFANEPQKPQSNVTAPVTQGSQPMKHEQGKAHHPEAKAQHKESKKHNKAKKSTKTEHQKPAKQSQPEPKPAA